MIRLFHANPGLVAEFAPKHCHCLEQQLSPWQRGWPESRLWSPAIDGESLEDPSGIVQPDHRHSFRQPSFIDRYALSQRLKQGFKFST
jgi:hypothetical protein